MIEMISREQRPITKEHIAMNLCPQYSGFLELLFKSRNSNCNTTSQSVFISFAMCMAHPLLQLFYMFNIYSVQHYKLRPYIA